MLSQHFGSFVLTLIITTITIQQINGSTEYNRYLAHLFQKYGNGGTMTFEGLEHLMANLGLGQIEFEPAHTIEEHRPKGFKLVNSTENMNTSVRSYFESQTKKLLLDDVEDMEMNKLKNDTDDHDDQAKLEESAATMQINNGGVILEFREMHDPKHRHPRESAYDPATVSSPPVDSSVCLSPKSLLSLVVDHNDLHKRKLYKNVLAQQHSTTTTTTTADDGTTQHNSEEEYNEFINSVRITPVAFMKLCPALLSQIDNHVCVRPAPLHADDEHDKNNRLWHAWIYASVSIFILSACGLVGILLVPLMKSIAYQEILKFLVAVAVGTLSGDALMHLLPHALESKHKEPVTKITYDGRYPDHDEEGHHEHDDRAVWLCGCAFTVAVIMYIIENLIPLLRGNSDGHGHGHGHGHSHGHRHEHNDKATNTATPATIATTTTTTTTTTPVKKHSKQAGEINIMLNEDESDKKSPNRPLTPIAFMVIIGDGLHNLTDGLAIGAAFGSDPVAGLATAFAVLCHELPHELGDFALLLQTGVSIKRAVCLNIVSSVLSFLGMAFGLLIASSHEGMTPWIYAGTAGSFLYIAFADLVPTMTVAHTPGAETNIKSMLIQILGIVMGGFIMLVIAVNEHDLEKLFKGW